MPFAGLAARRVGWLTVWACEIERSARAVYSARLARPELVPRMPSVRQVSSILTCGEFMATPKCSTVAGSPSLSSTALVIKRSPVGAPEENTLRAVMR